MPKDTRPSAPLKDAPDRIVSRLASVRHALMRAFEARRSLVNGGRTLREQLRQARIRLRRAKLELARNREASNPIVCSEPLVAARPADCTVCGNQNLSEHATSGTFVSGEASSVRGFKCANGHIFHLELSG